jgi:hypothetical protein
MNLRAVSCKSDWSLCEPNPKTRFRDDGLVDVSKEDGHQPLNKDTDGDCLTDLQMELSPLESAECEPDGIYQAAAI